MTNRLLDTIETSQLIGVHPATLATWRMQGLGPRYIKVGPRKVRYRAEDLDTWLTENTRTSTRGA